MGSPSTQNSGARPVSQAGPWASRPWPQSPALPVFPLCPPSPEMAQPSGAAATASGLPACSQAVSHSPVFPAAPWMQPPQKSSTVPSSSSQPILHFIPLPLLPHAQNTPYSSPTPSQQMALPPTQYPHQEPRSHLPRPVLHVLHLLSHQIRQWFLVPCPSCPS